MDSIVGETGELLSHNMFAYCANDPVNNEDSDGDIAWWVGVPVGGAISGVLFVGVGRVLKGARALNSARKIKHKW